ncbi:MAG: outer membrane beta-barrel protein [Bacteroidetes bacterium]|jgi:hypothetical protein|nr:outer membrane beta-barrel protein [Bacteroidota bacterium]
MRNHISLFILFLLPFSIIAQDWSGGIRAGLNYSRIDGPSELDLSGNSLERNTFSSGFHIGGMISRKLNSAVGLRGEILYTQRGTDYQYQGDSYFRFFTEGGAVASSRGTRFTTLRITNTYLDLPLSVFLRLGRIELSAGGYGSFMLSSRGVGELNYNGKSTVGQTIEPIIVPLKYDYFKDQFQQTGVTNAKFITVDNRKVVVPATLGAYYDARDTGVPLFNRVDAGLHAGLGIFMSQGLYLGARIQQGLFDLTRAEQELSLHSLDAAGKIMPRSDKDQNLSIQLSIGFSF